MCVTPILISFYPFLFFGNYLRATAKTNISSRLGTQWMEKPSKYILFNFIICLLWACTMLKH